MKKVYIIGAGAIGKVLAVFLKNRAIDAALVRATSQVHRNSENIDVILPDGSIANANVEVQSIDTFDPVNAVIVVTSKSFGNVDVASKIKGRCATLPVVLLQNGLKVEAPFLDGFESIYRCVLFATSQNVSENSLRFKPVRPSPIGIVRGSKHRLEEIVEILSTTFFEFEALDDIQAILWTKVISNCVFNSICPLLEVDNGIFHRSEVARDLARRVINECVQIANHQGLNLAADAVLHIVLMISKSSDGQNISTLQDILHKRQTEIESLNFAIVEIARRSDMEHIVSQTKLLGELVKLKSELSRQ